ncbi:hypothetical protein AAG906_020822 [Vitis piasezkii]
MATTLRHKLSRGDGKYRKDMVDSHGERVLRDPSSNDLVSKLVKECESTIDASVPTVKEEGGVHEREQEAIMVVKEFSGHNSDY